MPLKSNKTRYLHATDIRSHHYFLCWKLLLHFLLSFLPNQSAFLQQDLKIRSFYLLKHDTEELLFLKGKLHFGDRLLVDCIVAGAKELTDIILAAPDFRHTTVYIQQGVNRSIPILQEYSVVKMCHAASLRTVQGMRSLLHLPVQPADGRTISWAGRMHWYTAWSRS